MHRQATEFRFDQIASELTSRLGIAEPATDGKQRLTFALDEIVVLVEEVSEGILLTGFVDSLPDKPSDRLLSTCLISNLNAIKAGLPIMCIEETTRSLIIQLCTYATSTDEIMAVIGRFASQIESARDSISHAVADIALHEKPSIAN